MLPSVAKLTVILDSLPDSWQLQDIKIIFRRIGTLDMAQRGYAFIASHLQIEGDLPVEILPNYIFRSATDKEVEQIREYLATIRSYTHSWVAYEGCISETPLENGTSYSVQPLPRDKWKYWILESNGSNYLTYEIEMLGQLLPAKFDIGFMWMYADPEDENQLTVLPYMPFHVVQRYSMPPEPFSNAKVLSSSQIALLGDWYNKLNNLSEDHKFIRNAIRNFSDLRQVPHHSDLLIVGLFSIIESLITHAPRLTETLDSINHQITNKIILLRKKYSRVVVPSQYFSEAREDAVWKKLYGFRSAVAHGTPISFESDYQILKGRDNIIGFLIDNVKELILLSLHEPAFIFDLRKC